MQLNFFKVNTYSLEIKIEKIRYFRETLSEKKMGHSRLERFDRKSTLNNKYKNAKKATTKKLSPRLPLSEHYNLHNIYTPHDHYRLPWTRLHNQSQLVGGSLYDRSPHLTQEFHSVLLFILSIAEYKNLARFPQFCWDTISPL